MADLASVITSLGITETEAILALKSARASKPKHPQLTGKHNKFKYGYISDTHIGHKTFDEALFDYAASRFKQEKVDFILHPGDHLEGMSGRPGHIYELSEIGFEQQFERALKLYKRLPAQIYGIDGNHDQWYYQKNNGGVIVGKELERQLPNFTHLGEWEGDLAVDKIRIKLFHANDGTAYAHSYKLQKLIESFSGGEKPHIVHSGHYHKFLYMFLRNVHGFESGTLAGQSIFMRGKKLAAHKGFGINTVEYNSGGISSLRQEFVPAYE